jgi:hypothetical protein
MSDGGVNGMFMRIGASTERSAIVEAAYGEFTQAGILGSSRRDGAVFASLSWHTGSSPSKRDRRQPRDGIGTDIGDRANRTAKTSKRPPKYCHGKEGRNWCSGKMSYPRVSARKKTYTNGIEGNCRRT